MMKTFTIGEIPISERYRLEAEKFHFQRSYRCLSLSLKIFLTLYLCPSILGSHVIFNHLVFVLNSR